MWDLIKSISRSPRRSRKLSLLAANVFVASFLCSLFVAIPAFAVDATWTGNTLDYNGKSFRRGNPIAAGDARNPVVGTHVYESLDTATNTLEVLFIDKSVADPTKATSAQHVVYKDFTPPDTFSDMSQPTAVTIAAASTSGAAKATSTCDKSIFEGLGWILCPVSNVLAKAVDSIYGIIKSFLVVTTLTTDKDNSIFKIWQIVVSLANICFIIVFLYVVYLHLVSVNVQQYHLFKIFLPRLLVAAILVNVSYWICAVAVDASNLLGYSVEKLFAGVRESVGLSVNVEWSKLTSFILSAGTIGGFLGFAAATGGSFVAAGFLLISMLVSVVLAALAAFVILAARQALIVIFIIIAPLAFVAWTLPNTEKYFKKWLSAFSTLLLLFPIFSLLFGGSMLAGAAIMNSANGNLIIAIIGMAVQIIPLALTPMIVKFSSGILGQIANLTNNKKAGLADRSRNWATDNAKHHKLRKAARTDQFINKKNPFTLLSAQRVGRTMDRNARNRKMMDDENEELLSNRAGAEYRQRVRQSGRGKYANQRGRNMRSHAYHETANLYKDSVDADGEQHWADQLDGDTGLKDMKQRSHVTRGSAKVITDAIDASDERALQETVNASPILRNRKAAQITDAGIAKLNESQVEADGKLALQNTILGDRALRNIVVQTTESDNRAKVAEAIVQQGAEAHWNYISRTDGGLQNLRLREIQATDSAKLVEQEWNTFVEGIRAVGDAAPNLSGAASQSLANSIRRIHEDTQVQSVAQESAKTVQQQEFAELLKADDAVVLQAAGVGGRKARSRVLAKAKSSVSSALIEDIKNIQNTMDYKLAKDNTKLRQAFDSTDVFAEKIAYAKAMSSNGAPGFAELRTLLGDLGETGNNHVKTEDMQDFKELMAMEGNIMSAGKDIELFLTNMRRYDASGTPMEYADGSPQYSAFNEIRANTRTWTNLSANAFASQNATTQIEALEFLRGPTGDMEAYARIINSIRTNPNALGGVKEGVYKKFSIYSDAQYEAAASAGTPLPAPGTYRPQP